MRVPTKSGSRGVRLLVAPALAAAMLVLVASSQGGTAAGGFGEVYAAKQATSRRRSSTQAPADQQDGPQHPRVAFGRAEKKVNQNLALRCWKSNGCKTGTNGKLTVAYVEGFGENVYRNISKMEFIQALTYPEIGEIT